MAGTKPSIVPTWATAANAVKGAYDSAKRALGYVYREPPLHNQLNWLLNLYGAWFEYLDANHLPVFDTIADAVDGLDDGELGLVRGIDSDDAPWSIAWAKTSTDTGGSVLKVCSDGKRLFAATGTKLYGYNRQDGTTAANWSGLGEAVTGTLDLCCDGDFVYHCDGSTDVTRYTAGDPSTTSTYTFASNVRRICIDGELVIAALANGNVVAQNKAGATQWTNANTDPTGLNGETINAIASNGRIIAAATDATSSNLDQLYFFNRSTGAVEAAVELGSSSHNALDLAFARDGLVVSTDKPGPSDPFLFWVSLDASNHKVEIDTFGADGIGSIALGPEWIAYAPTTSTTSGIHAVARLPRGDRLLPSVYVTETAGGNDPINDVAMDPHTIIIASDALTSDSNRTIRVYRLPVGSRVMQRVSNGKKYRAPFYGAVTEEV